MKYLLDTNSVPRSLLQRPKLKNLCFMLREVIEEWPGLLANLDNLEIEGLRLIETDINLLISLQEVMKEHGDNLGLIDLYSNLGTGDILILAFLNNEHRVKGMFDLDWTLVTDDLALTKAAKDYGFKTINISELLTIS